jgi:PqqA peptide cyclase
MTVQISNDARSKIEQRPYALVAELTHRCPLHCPYCSNPRALVREELSTDAWRAIFRDAEALGVVHLHLTGGEPLARQDLGELAEEARALGLYVNLITSAIPLDRLEAVLPHVDHVQISFQDADERGDRIAGFQGHSIKLDAARRVRAAGIPLTVNVVLHRENIDRIDEIIALARELKADRLELANAQWHGFALANRAALMPTRAQIERAAVAANSAKREMDVLFVLPDHFGKYPRACMDGWANKFIVVAPNGAVLPCHAATSITTLAFERVGERSLKDIWRDSPALNAYRGDAWMPEPCRGCERRSIDHGGCRCQAFAFTGDAGATDPACHLSPDHHLIARARDEAPKRSLVSR